ncbi:MAG: hypothetical protein EP350_03475 [Alphaproteobacteria bacterium]|nr:MAG: hypothetical protein EP350_03475 [Alphaproteobacteria bacterium]
MIRWVWPLLMLAAGIVVTMVQVDRQSRRSPEIAAFAPEAVRGFGQYHVAAGLLHDGEIGPGVEAARKLVAARPMPAENLRLYAQAQLLAGNQQQAAVAFQQAARHGWRDAIAQEVQLRLALAADDHAEAARRLAALWATTGESVKLVELSSLTLADDESREAFAQILADSPRWNRRFLYIGSHSLSPEQFRQVLEVAIARGASFNCQDGRSANRENCRLSPVNPDQAAR